MKILILIDGSGWSTKSAMQAMNIAKEKNAEVTFLTVLDRSEAKLIAFNLCAQSGMCNIMSEHEEKVWRDMRRGAMDELNHLVTHFTKEKINCSMKMVEGDVRDEIIKEITGEDYSLIVMGAHGKLGKSHAGSLTGKIVGEVTLPVLVVK